MGSHKIKGFFSGIFGIYHQDQRKEEFQLHLLVKFIYSLGVYGKYTPYQWEGMEHPPGHCSKTATLPSKKREGVGSTLPEYWNSNLWLAFILA